MSIESVEDGSYDHQAEAMAAEGRASVHEIRARLISIGAEIVELIADKLAKEVREQGFIKRGDVVIETSELVRITGVDYPTSIIEELRAVKDTVQSAAEFETKVADASKNTAAFLHSRTEEIAQ